MRVDFVIKKYEDIMSDGYGGIKRCWSRLSREERELIPHLGPYSSRWRIRYDKKLFNKYRCLCKNETERNIKYVIGIEYRSFNGFNIDHIVSIYKGFMLGILPSVIGSPENLRVISHEDNIKKGISLTSESYYLLDKWGVIYK